MVVTSGGLGSNDSAVMRSDMETIDIAATVDHPTCRITEEFSFSAKLAS